jgi:predicted XRE-type DNA-binding protein
MAPRAGIGLYNVKTDKMLRKTAMPAKPLSARLRAQLRKRINRRIDELNLNRSGAADALGFTPAQMTRFAKGEDIFSLDRLVDAAAAMGLAVRMTATRPYDQD